jgi:hypothetical protein
MASNCVVTSSLVCAASQRDRVKTELRQLFDPTHFNLPAAVTLTMKKRVGSRNIDLMAASENFGHFMNRLNHKILGSAAKLHARRLKTVAVIESNADGRLHYHAMIDRPCYFSFEKFKVVVTDQWLRTDFGYRQIDIQDAATAGWTDYMLKSRQKTSLLDSIDWNNCHLDC